VKAFSTVPAPTLLAAEIDGAPLDTFVASDDDAAKSTVIDALQGSGLRALDAGVLANSRLLEQLTAFGIELGQRYKLGFDFGFKYLPTRATRLTAAPHGLCTSDRRNYGASRPVSATSTSGEHFGMSLCEVPAQRSVKILAERAGPAVRKQQQQRFGPRPPRSARAPCGRERRARARVSSASRR